MSLDDMERAELRHEEQQAAHYARHPNRNDPDHPGWACVYCGKELSDEHAACCGEVGHTESIHERSIT